MLNIIIFSKPIHSGKSTSLLNFTNQHKDVSGILMPVVNGKKSFYDITHNTYFEAEVCDTESFYSKTQIIGKYCFIDAAFKKANEIIIEAFQNDKSFIIIDEIGKLELRNEGLNASLQFILQSSSPKKNLSLLLVVRDRLLDEVIQFFQIKHYHVIHHAEELNEYLF